MKEVQGLQTQIRLKEETAVLKCGTEKNQHEQLLF